METNQNINNQPPKKKFNNAWIYVPLVLVLVASNIYLYNQKNNEKEVYQENVEVKDSTINTLKLEYEASLVRLDDLIGKNAGLDSMLENKNSEISKIKSKLDEITRKQRITEEEYKTAKKLIESLNSKLTGYEAEIRQLKTENQALNEQVTSLSTENQTLNEKVDMAKVLFASNITMTPINLKKGGTKEVETSKARKVDVLRIKFDIVKNLLEESGSKDFYLLIRNPEGELLSNPGLGSGSFITADGSTKYYSLSQTVRLNQGEELKDITVDWNQAASYQKGNYNVEIYYRGQQVGKSTVELK